MAIRVGCVGKAIDDKGLERYVNSGRRIRPIQMMKNGDSSTYMRAKEKVIVDTCQKPGSHGGKLAQELLEPMKNFAPLCSTRKAIRRAKQDVSEDLDLCVCASGCTSLRSCAMV
jgi:hypothetical protein